MASFGTITSRARYPDATQFHASLRRAQAPVFHLRNAPSLDRGRRPPHWPSCELPPPRLVEASPRRNSSTVVVVPEDVRKREKTSFIGSRIAVRPTTAARPGCKSAASSAKHDAKKSASPVIRAPPKRPPPLPPSSPPSPTETRKRTQRARAKPRRTTRRQPQPPPASARSPLLLLVLGLEALNHGGIGQG